MRGQAFWRLVLRSIRGLIVWIAAQKSISLKNKAYITVTAIGRLRLETAKETVCFRMN